jgi:hypothetical protein
MKIAVKIFGETADGAWMHVGSARVEQHEGRDVLRVTLDATPTTGRLCVALADLDVLRADSAAVGNA